MSVEKFLKLLENKTLPKLILFNACYSMEFAEEVHRKKGIITIGYNGAALDSYC
jgi:hypothetical protein